MANDAALNQQLAADPEWAALVNEIRAGLSAAGANSLHDAQKSRRLPNEQTAAWQQRQDALLRKYGADNPHDWDVDYGSGQVRKENFFQRNFDWMMPLAVFGAPAVAGA